MPAAAVAYAPPFAAPSGAAPLSAWADPRFRVPALLLGASVLAVGTFAVLHFTIGQRDKKNGLEQEPTKSNLGWVFPKAGVILCVIGSGLPPTPKPTGPGTFIVLWLADPEGTFIETTWARVIREDPEDPNRIFVVLTGEPSPVGPRPLRKEHGFTLSQAFWMTRDCVPEAINPLADPRARILCGPGLVGFDGPDADGTPDGLAPAEPPQGPVENLVGRQVEMLLVSTAGGGTAWQVPVVATILSTGPIGQVVTVRVDDVGSNEFADAPAAEGGHTVRPGATFDVTWDCVTKYR